MDWNIFKTDSKRPQQHLLLYQIYLCYQYSFLFIYNCAASFRFTVIFLFKNMLTLVFEPLVHHLIISSEDSPQFSILILKNLDVHSYFWFSWAFYIFIERPAFIPDTSFFIVFVFLLFLWFLLLVNPFRFRETFF